MSEDRWWLNCAKVRPMLSHLRFAASARKVRLFTVACCGRVRNPWLDQRWRPALLVSERFADGLATKSELTAARNGAQKVLNEAETSCLASWRALVGLCPYRRFSIRNPERVPDMECADSLSRNRHAIYNPFRGAWEESAEIRAALKAFRAAYTRFLIARAVCLATRPDGVLSPANVAEAIAELMEYTREVANPNFVDRSIQRNEASVQCCLLREIFGNPYRPVRLEPSWLAWNDGAVPRMATVIYDTRAFDRLPLLADALEDAGCSDEHILSYCRSTDEHVRGCWVLDLLLGKE